MDLAYDGAAFAGFAPQPGRSTVVGALGTAIAKNLRLGAAPFIVGAGRTDAGVHALAQVVSFDLERSSLAETDVERLVRSLNHQLAGRIAVARLRQIDDFHARYDATWRRYRYLVTSAAPLGFTDAIAWAVGEPLDALAMAEATALLEGVHDFRAFCKRPPDKASGEPLVRHVFEAGWRREPDRLGLGASGEFLVFHIRANAFCHNQVRRLVSTLVAVGRGALRVEEVGARLVSGAPLRLPPPAPAAGLVLSAVGYDERHGGPSGREAVEGPDPSR